MKRPRLRYRWIWAYAASTVGVTIAVLLGITSFFPELIFGVVVIWLWCWYVIWLDPPKAWFKDFRKAKVKRRRIRELYELVCDYETYGHMVSSRPVDVSELWARAKPEGYRFMGSEVTTVATVIVYAARIVEAEASAANEKYHRYGPASLWSWCDG